MRGLLIAVLSLAGVTAARADSGAAAVELHVEAYQPASRSGGGGRQDRLWLGRPGVATGERLGRARGEDVALDAAQYLQLECGLGADRWRCRAAPIAATTYDALRAALASLQARAAADGATAVQAVRCFVARSPDGRRLWCEGERARSASAGETPDAIVARLRDERRALAPPRWRLEVRVGSGQAGDVPGLAALVGLRYRDRVDVALRVGERDGIGIGLDAFAGAEAFWSLHVAAGVTVHRVLGPLDGARAGERGLLISPALRVRAPAPYPWRWLRRVDVDGRIGWTFAADDLDRAQRGLHVEGTVGYAF